MSEDQFEHDVIAAIRLAVEAAATAEAARAVIVELLAMAPESDGGRTRPVNLLVTAIRRAGARFEVTVP